ncbi:MAG: molybdopterin biosynthesis protein, partial [Rhodobacteraceae bacterium PARR1]
MILVLGMAAALWGIGALMKAPVRLRLWMIAALWAGVVLGHIVLPDGHPLRMATGGAAQGWVALGIIAALVIAYRAALARLRRRVAPVVVAGPPQGAFRPAELDRYARHILLREIGGPGQRRMKDARVLVVGAGGLGSPALMYLA